MCLGQNKRKKEPDLTTKGNSNLLASGPIIRVRVLYLARDGGHLYGARCCKLPKGSFVIARFPLYKGSIIAGCDRIIMQFVGSMIVALSLLAIIDSSFLLSLRD